MFELLVFFNSDFRRTISAIATREQKLHAFDFSSWCFLKWMRAFDFFFVMFLRPFWIYNWKTEIACVYWCVKCVLYNASCIKWIFEFLNFINKESWMCFGVSFWFFFFHNCERFGNQNNHIKTIWCIHELRLSTQE